MVQVIIHISVAMFATNIKFTFTSIVESGVLISFCLAIVSSIYFDAHFQKKHNEHLPPKEFSDLIFKLFPWAIVFMVTISTVLGLVLSGSDIDKAALIKTQVAAAALSYIYTAYYKYTSYLVGLKYAA